MKATFEQDIIDGFEFLSFATEVEANEEFKRKKEQFLLNLKEGSLESDTNKVVSSKISKTSKAKIPSNGK